MKIEVKEFYYTCRKYKLAKKKTKKYGKLLAKIVKIIPFHIIQIDCTGPYIVKY